MAVFGEDDGPGNLRPNMHSAHEDCGFYVGIVVNTGGRQGTTVNCGGLRGNGGTAGEGRGRRGTEVTTGDGRQLHSP